MTHHGARVVIAKRLFGNCEAELLAHESVEASTIDGERVPAKQAKVNNS
jgi:hypothetical protein